MKMNENTTNTDNKKYRMDLQYKGTGYSGWQIQPYQSTVQEVVSNALSKLASSRISVTGAGRTDSGVHALQQVAHFHFPEKESVPNLKKALNAVLPWDIRVTSVEEVSSEFHARKWALRKRYEYHFYTGEVFPPFLHDLALHIHSGFKLEPAAEAAAQLVGTHNFSAFSGSGTAIVDKVRSVSVSRFRQRGNILIYRIEANGFLFHMVRNIVGTLLEAGRGKTKPSMMSTIINSLDRGQAGPTAPPQGLYLAKIWY